MKLIGISLLSFVFGTFGAFTYMHWIMPEEVVTSASLVERAPTTPAVNINSPRATLLNEDFAVASANSTPSVVYIKTVSERYSRSSWLELFFEGRASQQVSSGSGVIYTSNGYIVTNNHVIDHADKIEIIHGKYTYAAQVVGIDPSTDLAVLKVEADNLPEVALGNSRNLQVGEWVLAVGNPFNLTSTVTAGIVSAKGRQINILRSNFPIESFIQTDAAINPGNSGGALVDKTGALVGINTAILSKTGSYAGYGFAVPVDIVRKVVDDIIAYGEVQKAFFGADVVDLTPQRAKELQTNNLSGVVLSYLQRDGSAEQASLQKGDVIKELDGELINSQSDFEELISYYSPGDEIDVTYSRAGKLYQTNLTLTNREGTTSLIERQLFRSSTLGADLEAVSQVEADLLKISNGVKVVRVKGGLMQRLNIEEGFIVTSINGRSIQSPGELEEILTRIRGKVRIEGVNQRGMKGYYSFYF
ncbi:trypsin-like peptidase domain-containing protein [Tunicatimonas pelagia]|uniref:trypsin-like peptidase domain-containing protein n=1 Tax=Tunicatimonas pelagia TaxID=931531 RepID=UPI002665C81C|nr:trypsin-like peptidase domain-containing protein [Tunicatimonas pelagia]WKN43152.1 trypsin-like peptidase domain-containing protein [Tunicatimonas pelagia]